MMCLSIVPMGRVIVWICVYCSSSSALDSAYVGAARRLGEAIAARGHDLVYGGASVGLMGTVAEAVKAGGGSVVGVIPEPMAQLGITFDQADELIVTASMAERKAAMIERADAFIALPGGFGTLEELLELLTLRQLGYAQGHVAILNTDGFYDLLLSHFERLYAEHFAKPAYRALYYVAGDVEEALDHVETSGDAALPSKWF